MLIKLKEVENNTAISLRKLIDIIPDPVICKDDDGLYTECNKEFEKVLGLKWEEIIGKGIFDNEELNIFCSFSFGISNFPDDGIEFNKLIFVADRRMYENKKEYKLKKLLCKSKDC